ncbi:MAG: hypothetical protein ACTS22_07995 [Phycisphaerales bacterium]
MRTTLSRLWCVALAVLSAPSASAGPVPVDPSDMLHLLVSQNGTSLALEFETPVFETPELVNYGEGYSGPGSVLNGTGYNAQYGWLADGFFSLPLGSAIFVRPVSIDPGLLFYDAFSFAPILSTSGSPDAWRWTGQMTHNWVAAYRPGSYEATLEVFVGNAASAAPVPGWGTASIDLEWFMAGDLVTGPTVAGELLRASSVRAVLGPVPTPGSVMAFGVGALVLVRRRRC